MTYSWLNFRSQILFSLNTLYLFDGEILTSCFFTKQIVYYKEHNCLRKQVQGCENIEIFKTSEMIGYKHFSKYFIVKTPPEVNLNAGRPRIVKDEQTIVKPNPNFNSIQLGLR